ncbi:MAG: hypothetical protein ACP6IY_00865 [Promethearchaeia archaeon]
MLSTIAEDQFLFQKINFKNRISNKEILYYNYFYRKTKIYPKFVFISGKFILFFVSSKYFRRARFFLRIIRKELSNNKIIIIKYSNIFGKLLENLFPDLKISDIELNNNYNKEIIEIIVIFSTYKERGIAIGTNGLYIKIVNEFVNNHINLENYRGKIKIICHSLSY